MDSWQYRLKQAKIQSALKYALGLSLKPICFYKRIQHSGLYKKLACFQKLVHGTEAPTGAWILHLSANTRGWYNVLRILKLSHSGISTASATQPLYQEWPWGNPSQKPHRNQPPFGQNLLKTALWFSDLNAGFFGKFSFPTTVLVTIPVSLWGEECLHWHSWQILRYTDRQHRAMYWLARGTESYPIHPRVSLFNIFYSMCWYPCTFLRHRNCP